MTRAIVLLVLGGVLVAATVLQDRPWQFGFALGVALLVAGATILVEHLAAVDVAGERSGPAASVDEGRP